MDDYRPDVANLATALRKGIEKVISTIGIHEVRGLLAPVRLRSGCKPELTAVLRHPRLHRLQGGRDGLGRARRRRRRADARSSPAQTESKPAARSTSTPRSTRRRWRSANGSANYAEYSSKVRELEHEQPVSLRHILDLTLRPRPDPDRASADPGVGLHSYPIVISSMSFGSQGETAYRAYAEAAKRINIVAMNGEGGEIRDMYGRYPLWRGQQVASGRFGVTERDDQLVLPRGDQDRPGGQARRGRPPAGQEGDRQGGGGPQRHDGHRPDLAVEQPRPLLDRGPGRADRRAQDRQPGRARLGEGAGGAEHRHDRRGDRQGGRRHHHALRLRGRHRRGALARAASRGAALGHRHAGGAPGADGGGRPQPRGDLGRRRLPPRLRHREAALPGRQPRGLRHAGHGLARDARSAAAASWTPATWASPPRSSTRRRRISRACKKFTPQDLERAATDSARFFGDMGEEVSARSRRRWGSSAPRTWSGAPTCSCRPVPPRAWTWPR